MMFFDYQYRTQIRVAFHEGVECVSDRFLEAESILFLCTICSNNKLGDISELTACCGLGIRL